MPVSIDALIMAAGSGSRFGSRKQFADLKGETVVLSAVGLFLDNPKINQVFVVYPPDMEADVFMETGKLPPEVYPVQGGEIREISVLNALKASKADYVLIHDAARPFAPSEMIERVIDTMLLEGAAVPAIKMTSTLKYLETDGSLSNLDSERVFAIQTPQGYRRKDILKAYQARKGGGYTDSSSIAAEYGMATPIVEGSAKNIKITRREDINPGMEEFR